ncbi:hypothetical protein C8J98_102132 [Luteibacter sp. OK325]|uniref:hypothetical protein n=1 Tax=Luteibacter sp. OK325 TaxID=2135670 RepID=UPI000D40D27A|nr:hypothetical protein [Luteibacter sp. OK325]PTR33945.1 hypothetical protein C8J98_102132 [Luteibacter sp. OK325]
MRSVGGPQGARMGGNDGSADGQAKARPVRLTGDIRLEDSFEVILGDAHACIDHPNFDATIDGGVRAYRQLVRSTLVGHRIARIENKVEHDLLKGHAIAFNLGKMGCQANSWRDTLARNHAAEDSHGFPDHVVDRERNECRLVFAKHEAKSSEHPARPFIALHDTDETVTDLASATL